MQLTADQLAAFERDGFLILPELFSPEEVAVIRAALPPLFAEETEANIVEKAGGAVRTAMGLHQRSPLFGRLVRHPRLIFGDTLVHGSPSNMSPWDRSIFSLIVNPVGNTQTRFARPEYKHHTDFSPVAPLADDRLLPKSP